MILEPAKMLPSSAIVTDESTDRGSCYVITSTDPSDLVARKMEPPLKGRRVYIEDATDHKAYNKDRMNIIEP